MNSISTANTMFFLCGFIVYIILMIGIAYITTRGKTSGEDYLMDGRNLGVLLLISTLAASAIGTGSAIGGTANGFRSGFQGSVFGFANALGFLTIGLFFVQVRKYNFRTVCEEVQFYFNGHPAIRKVMGIMMYIITLIWIANHINGGSKYLSYVTGLEPVPSKILTVLAFAIYVFIGGYMAVVWTDAIQCVLLLGGFIIITVMAIPTTGGIEAIKAAYIESGKAGALTPYGIGQTGIIGFLSLTVAAYWGAVIVPAFRMRVYTAKDEQTARKSMFSTGMIVFFFSLLPSVIGMAAFTIAKANNATVVFQNPDFAFHYMATTILGPFLGLLFLIAGLSATMSSADSEVIAGVTVFLTDIYTVFTKKEIKNEEIPKYSKYALILTLIIAFLITLYANDVMGYINDVVGGIAPGIGVAIILGRFWKKASWQGGLASIVGGFLFGVTYLAIPSVNILIKEMFKGPAIPVTILSLILGVVVSLLTPHERKTEEERLKLVMAERYYKD